ncbi:MAG: CHAT domain-containing protein [Thioploca sp.]|nr:CHAT domain-containing protein [Thioploca sp.]
MFFQKILNNNRVKFTVAGFIFMCFFSQVLANNNVQPRQQVQELYQQGNFTQTIEISNKFLKKPELDNEQHIQLLTYQAAAYQGLGDYQTALTKLQQALSLAQQQGTLNQQILVQSYLGDILLAMQQPDAAKAQLEKLLEPARTLNEPLVLANLLNNIGNVLSIDEDYNGALRAYQEAAEIAQRLNYIPLQIQLLSNQTQAYLSLADPSASIIPFRQALALVEQLPDNYDKGFQLLGLAQLASRLLQNQADFVKQNPQYEIKLKNYQLLTQVLQLANQYQDKRLSSYAKGYLGQLYEREQRYDEALQLTNAAIFLAQEIPDLLYLWEWQRARLFQAQRQLDAALVAYQQALAHLQPIRMELSIGQRNAKEVFYERIRPVYYGLADVLLQQSALATTTQQKNALLTQARDAIELLKAAELQDYFRDECVSSVQQTQSAQLDQIVKQQHTAVFYPILLTNRTELLLSLPEGIRQIVVPVDYQQLAKTVLAFRNNVQRSVDGSFVKQAKQLYNWLIVPLQPELLAYHIDTLVIVPDGPLRTIPFAALYNQQEKKFLFQEVALVVTPGLKLTEPHHLPKKNILVLLNGLAEEVQGFPPLPSVLKEVHNINELFPNATVLIDKNFSLNNINQALQTTPYQIIHISSHGQFDRDPKRSFLLTYDDKLTMDRLENLLKLSELRKEKVELLTLSACQTAVGDERAALGLAGVAIKAGARSALASLWFVDDEATSQLVFDFYQQLQQQNLSKAQALQQAQAKLAQQKKFRHPAYWAPFLLIGNWL